MVSPKYHIYKSLPDMSEERMDTNSADEESSSDNDDTEELDLAKAKELDEKLSANPYDYQAYLDRIQILKKLSELDRLRKAREAFAQAYPLSPDIWLSWIKDERELVSKS